MKCWFLVCHKYVICNHLGRPLPPLSVITKYMDNPLPKKEINKSEMNNLYCQDSKFWDELLFLVQSDGALDIATSKQSLRVHFWFHLEKNNIEIIWYIRCDLAPVPVFWKAGGKQQRRNQSFRRPATHSTHLKKIDLKKWQMIPPKKDLRSGQPQWGRDQSRRETNRTRRKPGSEEKCWFLEWHLCHTAQYQNEGLK